jgi:hypothetical protein
MNIYDEMVAAGVTINNHESDLYVPVNPTTTAILAKYYTHKSNATKFRDSVSGVITYDIPFAYQPWWDARVTTVAN